eukprot:1402234-Prymnesium_polylepis.1
MRKSAGTLPRETPSCSARMIARSTSELKWPLVRKRVLSGSATALYLAASACSALSALACASLRDLSCSLVSTLSALSCCRVSSALRSSSARSDWFSSAIGSIS